MTTIPESSNYRRVPVGIYIAQGKRRISSKIRMIRIETSVRRDQVIFVVIGRIESNDLPELKRVIESHDPPVTLDLKAVKLVDRDGVTFLANFEADNGRVTNCPPYIREWIRREREQQ